jgi:hypothetical protein
VWLQNELIWTLVTCTSCKHGVEMNKISFNVSKPPSLGMWPTYVHVIYSSCCIIGILDVQLVENTTTIVKVIRLLSINGCIVNNG